MALCVCTVLWWMCLTPLSMENATLENFSFACFDLGTVVEVNITASFAVFLTHPVSAGVINVICWLPTVDRVDRVNCLVGGGCFGGGDCDSGLTMIDSAALACCAGDPMSLTVTVKLVVPAAVGVPEITPVDAFRVNPAASDPELTDQVSLPVPPVAASCVVYAEPTTPGGRLAVETARDAAIELTTIACS